MRFYKFVIFFNQHNSDKEYMMNPNRILLIILLCLGFSVTANATVYRFSFTDSSTEIIELGGNGATNPPSGIFAFLDYDTTIAQFRLYDGPNAYLGSTPVGLGVGHGINGIAFNFGSVLPILGVVTYPTTGTSVIYDSGSMEGLTSITVPSVISSNFDVAYKTLNNGVEVITDAYKLVGGESETFAVTGFNNEALANLNGATSNGGSLALSAASVAVRVQSSTGNGVSWFTASSVSAVPELNVNVMMVFGLGFIGFVARQRKLI
jgi:hypothetical protein